MDRYATFVDAEYLYAEGGMLCCNTSDRREMLLYGVGANDFLMGLASDVSGASPLRTYWYDLTLDGHTTAAQEMIGSLPNIKLRLQRQRDDKMGAEISDGIRADLDALARERAICDAFVLSADAGLADVVADVQGLGVRVTLVLIASREHRSGQVADLASEADELVVLSKEDVSRFIRRRRSPDDSVADAYDPMLSVADAAAEFAQRWLDRASDDEFDALLDQRPRIPESLDGDLLYAVENVIGGSLRGQDRLRRAVRQAFWRRIEQELQDDD